MEEKRRDGEQGPGKEWFSDDEAARRRDEVIRRMANTPPQPRVSRPSGSVSKSGRTNCPGDIEGAARALRRRFTQTECSRLAALLTEE